MPAGEAAAGQPGELELPLPAGAVDIDGSQLEGGGQILRLSAALATITGTPIRVSRIRANRAKPGLRPQHLAGLQLVARLCGGELAGGSVGSTTVTLVPGRLQAGSHTADTGTAGSCTLLAQVALPPLLFAPTAHSSGGDEPTASLDLRGGTDADLAPPASYLQHVLLPTLRRHCGLHVEDKLLCRGFFPRGGGRLQLAVRGLAPGARLPPLQLTDRGPVEAVAIHAFAAGNLKASVAQRMAAAARRQLSQGLEDGVPISEHISHHNACTGPAAAGEGAGILITATTQGGCVLGAAVPAQRGTPPEAVGSRAASELLEDLAAGGCVDRWLEDQLVVFMALSSGTSHVDCGEPSLHTRTAMLVAQQLTAARFTVQPPASGRACWRITCQGAGIAA